tara:strand:+ start:1058 stop:1204 length:147 start_codon:yes stop_codon:yes gene_type:complete
MEYNKVKITQHSKHEYEWSIGKLRLGIWERSELRELMETIDNNINTGL